MTSWVADLKNRTAADMDEFHKSIEEGNKLKALKATEELLAEYQSLLQKHKVKSSIRKMEAESTLLYWKKQAEISVIKTAEALEVLASLDNPVLTREISRLEKKLKSLGVEVGVGVGTDSQFQKAAEEKPLGAKTPLPPSARAPPLTAKGLEIPKKQPRQILPRSEYTPNKPPIEEEASESTSYAPIHLTQEEVVRELMRGF